MVLLQLHLKLLLKLIETLLEPPRPEVFPFMETSAYADKSLATALGAWASMRHTWQLQAKQSVNYMGMTDPPEGWVEPNVAFYSRLNELVAHTISILRPLRGVDIPRRTR